jgi:hypothetical protein
MLVPERGDPTTKIGLFMFRSIQALRIIRLLAASQALPIQSMSRLAGRRSIQKLPSPRQVEFPRRFLHFAMLSTRKTTISFALL